MHGMVGIIFMYGRELLLEKTPVDDAEDYGSSKTHPNGHQNLWDALQRSGKIPLDVEYDEVPRGRVTYDGQDQRFRIFLDRCIRKQSNTVDQIIAAFGLDGLGSRISVEGDSHYRCPACTQALDVQDL